jgi:hypothetical protein
VDKHEKNTNPKSSMIVALNVELLLMIRVSIKTNDAEAVLTVTENGLKMG